MKKTMLLMSTAILATAFLAACGPSSKDDGTITRLEQNGNTLTVCDFAKVKDTLLKVAEIYGNSPEEIGRITSENALKVFGMLK